MSPPLHARISRALRVRKRIALRYGQNYPLLGSGFTTNLSSQGLAIAGSSLHWPGTPVNLELHLPGEGVCLLGGRIIWAMRGAPAIRQPNMLGVAITRADEAFYRYLLAVPGLATIAPMVSER